MKQYWTITYYSPDCTRYGYDSKIHINSYDDGVHTLEQAREYAEKIRGDRDLWYHTQKGKK